MLERNILIVDDNPRIASIYIPAYSVEIDSLKSTSDKWQQYSFKIDHCATMREALEFLSESKYCVDVLVVDYDFNGESTFSSGTAFVKYVRESINRYCQIVFYTMQGITSIDKDELVDLVNSDVYKLVDKSDDHAAMAKVLFDAATLRNPTVESLERFYSRYSSMLQSYKYCISGEIVCFDEIINHIRMDDKQGRLFVDKLLQKAILLDVDIEA